MARRASVQLTPGVVLHRRAYRDTSLLLECMTRTHGRLGLVARGARAPRARLAAVLQPFQPLLLSFGGGDELSTLYGAEADGAAFGLAGAPLAAGFYASELLLRACQRDDPHPLLYDAYLGLLGQLVARGVDEPALRAFELTLLREIGYALALTHDVHGTPLRPDGAYAYQSGHGPVPVAPEDAGAIPGATLLALAAGTLGMHNTAALRVARHLLRRELAAHLGSRPLASRRLYAALAGAASET